MKENGEAKKKAEIMREKLKQRDNEQAQSKDFSAKRKQHKENTLGVEIEDHRT